jgi:hypothetical protein
MCLLQRVYNGGSDGSEYMLTLFFKKTCQKIQNKVRYKHDGRFTTGLHYIREWLRKEILSKRRVNTVISINANLCSTISSYTMTKLNIFVWCKHCYEYCFFLNKSSCWYTVDKNFCISCGQISPLASKDMVYKNIQSDSKMYRWLALLSWTSLKEALMPYCRTWFSETCCTMQIWGHGLRRNLL